MKNRFLPPLVSLLLLSLHTIGYAQTGGGYDLTWSTLDGGGMTFSSAGDLELGGTIGQPDAGTHSHGELELSGGFWVDLNGTLTSVFDCDLVFGSNPSLNPRCDCFDLMVVLNDLASNNPMVDCDFNNDGVEDSKDLLMYTLVWNHTP